MRRTVLAVGLQRTGKTTFLAAFWDVVRSGHVVGALRMRQTDGDMQYLNDIRDAWADCREITRTGPASDRPVLMLLEDTLTGAETDLAWTDMLGESFERQWTERAWTRAFRDLVDDAVGAIVFLHPRTTRESQLIIEAQRALKSIAEPGISVATPGPLENDADRTVPRPFDPRLVPTQVLLVDLLQNIESRRSGRARLKLSLAVSAWDAIDRVAKGKTSPKEWLQRTTPLLDQYLQSNDDRYDVRAFGISAQGGELTDAPALRRDFVRASDRIRVVCDDNISQDVTAPVRWAVS